MQIQHISINSSGRFSQLICDYIKEDERLHSFLENYPSLETFDNQIKKKKKHFSNEHRSVLVEVLKDQYTGIEISKGVEEQFELLKDENTFTVTTGHQLCLMTGPLYFIYKIISTLNLCKQLKVKYPKSNFVPIYWMASEDHDFEEISSFQFQNKKIRWKRENVGPVGRLPLNDLQEVLDVFQTHLGIQPQADKINNWLEKSYRKANNLSEATFQLVNELFGDYGLLVLEPNNKKLKALFAPYIEEELIKHFSHSHVLEQIELLREEYDKNYTPQVNPREINMFYISSKGRFRLEKKDERFILHGSEKSYSKKEVLELLKNHPERFSPNVLLRPLYQEVVLPNLCYIGGGAEIAYWLQLKKVFDRTEIPFPSLLVRNSILLYSEKQAKKIKNLNLSLSDLFLDRNTLISKKIQQISNIDLNLTFLKTQLKEQFTFLNQLTDQTDKSFRGAVRAQEKKQLKGIDKLEKRLLKAQKRVLSDEVQRLTELHDQLFPNDQLQERNFNFFTFYIEIGEKMIPSLLKLIDPLNPDFTLIEY